MRKVVVQNIFFDCWLLYFEGGIPKRPNLFLKLSQVKKHDTMDTILKINNN